MAVTVPVAFLLNPTVVRNSSGIPYVVGTGSPGVRVARGNAATPTSFTLQDTANQPACLYSPGSAAIDSAGIIHIVYRRDAGMGNSDVAYIQFNTNTNTYSTAEQVFSEGSDSASVTQITLDAAGKPHVFATLFLTSMGTDYRTVCYKNRVSGSWSSRVDLKGVGQLQNWGCVASGIEPSGRPFCVGISSGVSVTLFHSTSNTPTSFSEKVLTSAPSGYGTGRYSHAAVNSAGDILIHTENPSGTGKQYFKPAAQAMSGTWTTITTGVDRFAQIVAVGPDFYQVVMNTFDDRMEYRKLTSGVWGSLQTGATIGAAMNGGSVGRTQYFNAWGPTGLQVSESQTTNVRSELMHFVDDGTTGSWDTWTVSGGGGGGASLGQAGYRFRNDNGSETTATWAAAINTGFTLAPISNPDFRLRFLVRNTGGASATKAFKLQYSKNSGAYADITTSTGAEVHVRNSTNITNGVATTEQLAGAGTFVAGQVMDTAIATSSITLAAGEDTEIEFCLGSVAGSLANNDTLDFRLVDNTGSVVLDSYSQTPRATVSKPAVVGLEQVTWTRTNNQFVEGSDLTGSPSSYPSPGIVEVFPVTKDPLSIVDSRWRFLIKNTSGGQLSAAFKIQCRVNNGAGFGPWTDLPAQSNRTAGVWTMREHPNVITEGEATTQRIGSGSFVPGELREISNTTGTITLNAGQETEVAFSAAAPWDGAVADDATFELRIVKSNGDPLESYLAYPSGSFKTVNVTQTGFRFRNDDGTEATATWQATLNTNVNQTVGNRFRLRFRLQGAGNDGDTHAIIGQRLQYRKDDQTGGGFGPWTFVGPGAEVDFSASPNVAHNASTTEQIGGTGTFWQGRFIEQVSTGSESLPQPTGAEYEFSLALDGPSNLNDDRFEYRMLHYAETPFWSYTSTPDHRAIKPPAVAQQTFRFRNDDGTEATATWRQAANTNDSITITGATNVIRLRFGVRETSRAALTDGFTYQFRVNGGAWQTVAGGTAVGYATGSQLVHNGATTQQITTGTFLAGRQTESTVAPTTVAFAGRERSEFEAAFNLNAANFTSGDVVDFRLVYDGITALDTYDVTPSLTITVGSSNQNLSGNEITSGAPATDGGVLSQAHSFAASPIDGSSPTVDSAVLAQVFVVGGEPVTGTPPTIDNATLAQAHGLSAQDLSTGPPAAATSALTQNHNLSGTAAATTSVAGQGALTQAHVLAGSAVAAGTPSLATALLGQVETLTANAVAASPATLDSPALGQGHTLTVGQIEVSSPLVDSGALTQQHSLSATEVLLATPQVANGSLSELVDELLGDPIAGALPVIDSPTLGQTHILAGGEVSTSPELGSPTLGQTHILAGGEVVVLSVLDNGALAQDHNLAANEITSTATVDSGTLSQSGALSGTSITSGQPALGPAGLTQNHDLTSTSVAAQPAVDSGTLAQSHDIAAPDIIGSAPSIGSSSIDQSHATAGHEIFPGAPSIDSGTLVQRHTLAGGAVSTSPVVDEVTLFEGGLLFGVGVVTQPLLDSSTLAQHQQLSGGATTAGTPLLDSGALAQGQQLSGEEVNLGPASLDSGAIAQAHALEGSGLTLSVPVLGTPDLAELVSALFGDEVSTPPWQIDLGALAQTHTLLGVEITLPLPQIARDYLNGAGDIIPPRRKTSAPSRDRAFAVAGARERLCVAGSRCRTVVAPRKLRE